MESKFNCTKDGCEEPATLALKLSFVTDEGQTGSGFMDFHVCEAHPPSDAEIQSMLALNWPKFTAGFRNMKMPIPVLEKTTFQWAPIEEELKFYGLMPEGKRETWL
jgi:hypothetical protein